MASTAAAELVATRELSDDELLSSVLPIPLLSLDTSKEDSGFDLTLLKATDAEDLYTILQDEAIHRNTLNIPYPYTMALAHQFIGWCQEKNLKGLRLGYPPLHRCLRERATGKIVGCIGVVAELEDLEDDGQKKNEAVTASGGAFGQRMIKRIVNHRAEVGYYLDARYRGKGLMPMAVRAICRIAFSEPWSIYRLEGTAFAFNESSRRTLVKSGFVFEGVLRGYHRKRGLESQPPYDCAMHAMLREDFHALESGSDA
ncbi:hypothetical protein HDU67_004905 [Dinochytrium kinnereticum]|nr:hypothetical protein HDU67_004905 [Dinochytrium kinnereticum]